MVVLLALMVVVAHEKQTRAKAIGFFPDKFSSSSSRESVRASFSLSKPAHAVRLYSQNCPPIDVVFLRLTRVKTVSSWSSMAPPTLSGGKNLHNQLSSGKVRVRSSPSRPGFPIKDLLTVPFPISSHSFPHPPPPVESRYSGMYWTGTPLPKYDHVAVRRKIALILGTAQEFGLAPPFQFGSSATAPDGKSELLTNLLRGP